MCSCRRNKAANGTVRAIALGVWVAGLVGCASPRPEVDTTGQSFTDDPLVDLAEFDPRIVIDIRYATSDNFVGRPLYPDDRCLLRRSTARALSRVQDRLARRGLGLKVYDGFRPLAVQRQMWAIMPDARYVADPATGSRHNRGAAVDVTLVDRRGRELDMPTAYDDFTEAAHRDYTGGTEAARGHRDLLAAVMAAEGFTGLPTEWWHFDGPGWEAIPLLDIPWPATPVARTDPADRLSDARQAMQAGRFTEAEEILRPALRDPDGPVVDEPAVLLEIMRRMRLDYNLSSDAMLAKLRTTLPDVAADDVTRWREQGVLQHRVIDGEVRYFNREPSNLFRFCAEARQRREVSREPDRAGWKFDLPAHLARLLASAGKGDDPEVCPVKHHVTYRLAVKPNHPCVKSGAKVRCWLPCPQGYRQQRDVRLIKTEPEGGVIAPNGHPQRTIYFEHTITDPKTPLAFQAEFEFVTSAYCPRLDLDKVEPYDRSAGLYKEYTAERAPHIVFTPAIRQVVADVGGDEPNPLARARKLFHWMDGSIRYCAEMEYSTIPSIAAKAIETRRGDCGVQGLLFITLCRAAGVPARWQSGWESKPNGWNMHDWAEFYVEPWGWLPADPSYGLQDHPDPRVREFYCGHLDAYRMIVNLDYARELSPPKTSFRSEPNDFQRGEIEIDGHNLYFNEWEWTFRVRTVPLTRDRVALEEALDAVVPDALVDGKMSGAVILVGRQVEDGYETWEKAYGYKQTQPTPIPMTTDAIFDLASMTKPIATGTCLMILADQGKLKTDDPVANYLPEFAEGKKSAVTIGQLMTHMSGERPYVHASEQKELKEQAGFPCREAIREYIRELPLLRAPGEALQYSCLNAILGAEIVRTITGDEHDVFAREHIFQPLGMRDTGFTPPESLNHRLVPTTRAAYGRGEGGFLLGQVHDPIAAMQGGISGNAGLFSTAADLSRFAQMMLNRGSRDGVQILKPRTVHRMTSTQNPGARNTKGEIDRRGLLWDVYQPEPGDRGMDAVYAYGHTGYTGTAIRIYPEHGLYIIALANRVHPDDRGSVSAFRRIVWRTVGEALLGIDDSYAFPACPK